MILWLLIIALGSAGGTSAPPKTQASPDDIVKAARAMQDAERLKARVIDRVLSRMTGSVVAGRLAKAAAKRDPKLALAELKGATGSDATLAVTEISDAGGFCLRLTLTWENAEQTRLAVGCS